MPQTILFVDEEKFVHKALKRSFRKMRQEWDMRFAASPREAMEIMNKEAVEVVVTETVFQGQSGLDFLKVVREGHPNSARIILSGYADQEVILKSVDLAHQYLAKPCEDEALKATISRAFMMKELLDHRSLKEIVSKIDSLPTLPAIYVELVEELKAEDASIDKIGDIISKDIGLTTKILKMVNSSFFGLRQHITNPAKAVSLLGLDLIKAIVLTSGAFDKFKNLKYPGFSLEQMWEHAMTTGTFAKIIAKESGLDRKASDTAFMAGLLHDIGKLLIAAHLPDSYRVILKLIQLKSMSMAEAETAVIGTTHAGVGAYLLGLWGLPDAIVHVANAFAGAGQQIHQPGDALKGLDYAYLEDADILPKLEDWGAACADHITPAEPG
jgi:putative nucleotidyltransferase with HDIG domain